MVLKTKPPPICYFQVRANTTLNYLVLRTGGKNDCRTAPILTQSLGLISIRAEKLKTLLEETL